MPYVTGKCPGDARESERPRRNYLSSEPGLKTSGVRSSRVVVVALGWRREEKVTH